MNSFPLFVLYLVELLQEAVNVGRRLNLDSVGFALVEKERKLPFGVFTLFNLFGVREIVGRLLFVQINEMCKINVTEFIHYVPRVIFGYRQLVQPHNLRSEESHL